MKERFICRILLAFITVVAMSSVALASATITIQNNDGPNTGFNDPTPVTPIGGNNGTTLGEQRLIAFQFAANIWGATINSAPVITVRANWSSTMTCTANTAVLGSAGSIGIRSNFANGLANTWYSSALANALAGTDLSLNPEINAQFNARIGQAGCLQNRAWYLGLDGNHGSNVDLVAVLLHEFGHGLGFQSFTNEGTGVMPSGMPSIYDRFLRDNTTAKTWDQMTDAERVASAINSGNLVWVGSNVISDVPSVLSSGADGAGRALMYAPNPVEDGSSISHFDRSAFPNQLMEPSISGDLTHRVIPPFDLAFSLLRDLGWTGATAINPIDGASFFARQHYLDFLNREPDAAGLAFWTNEITSCGADAQCIEVKRINVSAAFFLSIEFQETGFLVYRMYKAAYGDTTSPNVVIPVPIIRFNEFLPDAQRVAQGVQVGIGNWQGQLEANKTAYAREFVVRQRFLNAYPLTLTAAQFVNQLNLRAGNVLSAAEQNALIAELNATGDMTVGRASVLRKVAEDADLRQRETNRAFVLMQYYGYMRRNPDDPPDTDFRGWEFWLNKLNLFNGNFIQAEMVKAFITSIEYRQRFGQ